MVIPSSSLTTAENHRVRVAREKRERMREHLLRSVLAVCSDDRASGSKVIDDVIRFAEVSRGTFYKHFGSLEEAISELGACLADEMARDIVRVYDVLVDPRERLATGVQLFLRRAMIDPHWGGFVAYVELPDPNNQMIRHMVADLKLGIAEGLYDLEDWAEGMDVLLGTKIEAIRRIVRSGLGKDYVVRISALILRGLGQPSENAFAISQAMAVRLELEAPQYLSWWKA
ncbi:hypothetical protein WBP07_20960 (plasmid) [Novosphingobium sp. BL-8A]|uniref:TetR/AcrR family transcriptional regulator n=1 Tax=Novosphingobium sp. BL-8A TaxID=3127639 RepID=UPI0037574816